MPSSRLRRVPRLCVRSSRRTTILKLDRILAGFRKGILEPHRVRDVLSCLASASDVRLDGKTVKVSDEPIPPRVVVEDDRRAVVLRMLRNNRISEVVERGIALVGDTLHPLAELDWTGDLLERLPLERRFATEQLGELVTEILPELGRRVQVEVRSKRLPKTAGKPEVPRIRLDYEQAEHTLSVLPTLVYGDPPRARIDDGKLVHLSGAVPIRDEAAERELMFRLRDQLNLVFGRRSNFDGREAARFLARLQAFSGEVDQAGNARFAPEPLSARIVVEGDRFDVAFERLPGRAGTGASTRDEPDEGAAATGGRADAAAVIRAWQDGLGWAPLDDGGWAPLPMEWLTKHGHRVAELLAARRDDRSVPVMALPLLGELCDEIGEARPPGLQALEPLLAGFESIRSAELPADLTASLRPYQRQGVNWLCFLQDLGAGAVLADDMGLGKTLQAMCAFRGRTLVVCPKSVLFNWADEIKRFRPKLRVCAYHGPTRKLEPEADVTLTTYAVLRLSTDELCAQVWDTVVLDEAQNIKNSDSQVARASYALPGRFRLALSGTPVENRLEELWSVFFFASPGLLGSRADFQERYVASIAAGQTDAAARLRTRIRPFLLRRTKREVAPELPPRTDQVLYCELDETERAVYDAVRAATQRDLVAKLLAGAEVNMMAALEALLRLRQASCHPQLVPGQQAATSAKTEALREALEDAVADGHKSLVFSQWTSLLDLLEPHLQAAGIAFERLDGSTQDRAGVVHRFQAAGGPPVLLASLKAGGTGLNLTAADHVFLLDPWWNPAAEDQAADRAHRIGQDKPVMVYRLVAKDTVEERILALQERKRALADVAMGDANKAAELTRDDLMALLQ